MLSRILSYYKAELFPILKQCRCVPCLFTLLKNSQSWNITDVLPVLLHGWAFPNLKTFLKFTWDVLNVETWWRIPFHITLWTTYNIAESKFFLHCWAILNLKTFLSIPCSLLNSQFENPCCWAESLTIAHVYLIFLHCRAPNITYAELVPILKHCRCVPCHNTLLKCSQSWNIADVNLVLLHCWAVPYLETLLKYTLSYYNAELLPVLKHCRCVPSLTPLLKSSRPRNVTDVLAVLLHWWAVPNLETLLMYTLS